jgi:hypothetical protein
VYPAGKRCGGATRSSGLADDGRDEGGEDEEVRVERDVERQPGQPGGERVLQEVEPDQ